MTSRHEQEPVANAQPIDEIPTGLHQLVHIDSLRPVSFDDIKGVIEAAGTATVALVEGEEGEMIIDIQPIDS